MINFYYFIKENIEEQDSNQPQISNHAYKMLISGSSVSCKIH